MRMCDLIVCCSGPVVWTEVLLTQMLIELLLSGAPAAQERAVKALRELVQENPAAHEHIAKAGNPAQVKRLEQIARPSALMSLDGSPQPSLRDFRECASDI